MSSPDLAGITRALRGYKIAIDRFESGGDNKNHSDISPAPGFFMKNHGSKNPSQRTRPKPRLGNTRPKKQTRQSGPGAGDRLATDHHLRALLESDFDPRMLLRAVRNAQGEVVDFLIAEANEDACAYNRLVRAQFVGQRLKTLFPNCMTSGLFAMYCRVLETQETLELRDFSYQHDIRDEKRAYNIRAVPFGDELSYTWRDVTDHANATRHARPLALERRMNQNRSDETKAQIRELQTLAHRLLEQREQEQQDLSRELHDNIAQVLSAATARISLAQDEPVPAWLRQELVDLRDQLRSALEDVRHLARDLRPALMDHLGFAAALEKHADGFRQRTRMTLEVCVDPEAVGFLDNGNLTHLFRLTQEALQNIEEHSGAKNAWINLLEHDGAAHLEIGDDGCAFTPERVVEAQRDGHLGLLGMRERAELIGARFVLEAVPDQGTVINIIIPPRANTP